jgi:hypothetical protein
MENHIARAEDIRKAAQARRAEVQAPERVVLPESGYAVVLRRPTPMWFLFHGYLPMSLAARQQAGAGDTEVRGTIQTAEEFVEFSKWIVDLLSEVFVGPKLSLNPGDGEISPEWLTEEDVNFIIRWAVGEVTAEGSGASGVRDLAEFRGKKAGVVAASRPGRRVVPLSAEPAPEGDDHGSSD